MSSTMSLASFGPSAAPATVVRSRPDGAGAFQNGISAGQFPVQSTGVVSSVPQAQAQAGTRIVNVPMVRQSWQAMPVGTGQMATGTMAAATVTNGNPANAQKLQSLEWDNAKYMTELNYRMRQLEELQAENDRLMAKDRANEILIQQYQYEKMKQPPPIDPNTNLETRIREQQQQIIGLTQDLKIVSDQLKGASQELFSARAENDKWQSMLQEQQRYNNNLLAEIATLKSDNAAKAERIRLFEIGSRLPPASPPSAEARRVVQQPVIQQPAARTPPTLPAAPLSSSQAMGGVGLLIGTYDGLSERPETMYILKIVPGSPAEQSRQIQVDDQLVKVNGISTNNLKVTDVFEMIRGPEGTTVMLDFVRNGQPFQVQLARRSMGPETPLAGNAPASFGLRSSNGSPPSNYGTPYLASNVAPSYNSPPYARGSASHTPAASYL